MVFCTERMEDSTVDVQINNTQILNVLEKVATMGMLGLFSTVCVILQYSNRMRAKVWGGEESVTEITVGTGTKCT